MGTGCFKLQSAFDINNNNQYNNNPTIVKIARAPNEILIIQKNLRVLLAKLKLSNYMKKQTKKLLIYLDQKKLLNTEIITNSKSEKHYQHLLNTKQIKPYSEHINRNPKLITKLKIMSKYTIELPYYIVTSNKEAFKGALNLNQQYHGYGVIYQFNNITETERRVEGIFTNGILNGYGRIIISNEEMIRGDFALNKLNGLGEYHRKDGSLYVGAFYNGHPQGNGRETFKDGSSFEGYYFNGKKKYGKFEWKDKNSYEGYFENDLFNGLGTYKWGDKKQYEGYWKNGKMNGKGKLTYSDKSFYDGEFVDGMKQGTGKYVWKSNIYYGEWKNDIQNGYGIYYTDGKKIKGFWENGKLKNESNANNFSTIKMKRLLSSDKIRGRINEDMKDRFTYSNNMGMIAKISGDKISGKGNEEENDAKKSSKNSIRSSYGSVYSIDSILKNKQMENKENKDYKGI
jgi:hypothetical protein